MKKRSRIWHMAVCFCMTLLLAVPSDYISILGETAGKRAEPEEETSSEEVSSEENVFEIGSVSDFLIFVENCKYDSWSLGKTIRLTADLDLSSLDFGSVAYFNGTLEGNGHTISHVSLGDKGSNMGFFRYVGENGIVKDLNLSGKLLPSGSQENIGGIVGTNYGLLSNCSFEGSVEGKEAVGAIVGYNKASGKILDCSSDAVVLATNYTGGIAGKNDGLITGCVSASRVNVEELETTVDLGGIDIGTLNITRNVVTRNDMGGIAGVSVGIITECKNTGTVGFLHLGYNVGGIAGRQSGKVINCTNEGKLFGRKDVGGIVGQAEPYVESEYLEDKVRETREDVSRMNRSLNNISAAISSASSNAKGYMDQLSGSYNDSLSAISSNMDQLSAAVSANHPEAQGNVDAINQALDRIHGIQNSGEGPLTQEQLDEVQANINTINDNLGNLQGVMSENGDSAGEFVKSVSGELKESANNSTSVAGLAQTVDQGIQSVAGSINNAVNQWNRITGSVGDTVSEILDEDSVVQDISSVETAENTDGVISGCTNRGEINGDLNAGGIAGTMNIEYDVDPEFDLELTNELNITLRSTVNDVITKSINYGAVRTKRNCGGGIVGLQELGLLYLCEGYGSVASDSGSYLGGIAGESAGTVWSCYSLCSVDGTDYTGGISGDGYSIKDSIAVAKVNGAGECRGSIAGFLEEEGEVSGNYFAGESAAGVDDISYAGMADKVTYEEIMAMEGIPEGFRTVTVTFESEEGILESREIAYGGSISEAELPALPEKEGCYAKWQGKNSWQNIRENLTVTAEYVPWTQSVAASVRAEDGRPLFLAAGEFYGDTALHVKEIEGPGTDGQTAYAYEWSLESGTPKEFEQLEGHFYVPGTAEIAEVWYLEQGAWKKAKTAADGSYLVANLPYGAGFALVTREADRTLYYAAAAAAAAAVLIILAVRRHNKKKRKKAQNGEKNDI